MDSFFFLKFKLHSSWCFPWDNSIRDQVRIIRGNSNHSKLRIRGGLSVLSLSFENKSEQIGNALEMSFGG